jgi:coenzyme F420-dependent oxidoreductase
MSDLEMDFMFGGGGGDLDATVDQVQYAEELGYEYVSLGETTGIDGITLLTLLAERTEEIGLANDVFSPYSRTPALLGQSALSLHRVSGGRNRLGLGTSSPALVEHWHGMEFDRPLRRLREAIEIIRQVYSGDRLDYEGEIFQARGLQFANEVPDDPPEIDVAALGPKAVELAGRFADGWTPQFFTPEGLEQRLEDLHRGADLGDRDPDDLRVALTFRACAHEDREHARELGRNQVAFMIGRYGPYYRQSVAEQGWEDVTQEIKQAYDRGNDEAAVAAVPDELLDGLVAAGTPDEVRETVDQFRQIEGLDALRIAFFAGTTREEEDRTLEALAPE